METKYCRAEGSSPRWAMPEPELHAFLPFYPNLIDTTGWEGESLTWEEGETYDREMSRAFP